MAKLLKSVKTEIIRKACAETFKARRAELNAKQQELYLKVYNRIYTE